MDGWMDGWKRSKKKKLKKKNTLSFTECAEHDRSRLAAAAVPPWSGPVPRPMPWPQSASSRVCAGDVGKIYLCNTGLAQL